MAFEQQKDSTSELLSRIQSATISALNAREAGKAVEPVKFTPDYFAEVNGRAYVEGYLKGQRKSVRLALKQHEAVTQGTLPLPILRSPDIEPFFLP